MKARDALQDPSSFAPRDGDIASTDPLDFPGYAAALERARAVSGADEAVIAGHATIGGHPVELALFRFDFMGGSMGEAAGERLARGLERAADRAVPFVLRVATGGARIQEGMRSLVQMPKLVAVRIRLAQARQPLIALLAHPTTGGVLASVAALADVTFAEADAVVGFAGPRMVEAFTGAPLRGDSHTAPGALRSGLVDGLVERDNETALVTHVLDVLAADEAREVRPPDFLEPAARAGPQESAARSQPARAPELVAQMSDALVWLRGDRAGRDDPGVAVALARVRGRRALTMALDRDHPPGPAAYRKARRAVAVAARLGLPIVTLVDTPGADPSESSEAGGIAWEVAGLFEALLTAPVPVLSLVTGEGGSGGALAFAAGDALVAFARSSFSVLRPDAAATILWRDPRRAGDAARVLKPAAHDLVRLGIGDALVAGPVDAPRVADVVAYHLDRLSAVGAADRERVAARLERWRRREQRL